MTIADANERFRDPRVELLPERNGKGHVFEKRALWAFGCEVTREEALRSSQTASRLEASKSPCIHDWEYLERQPGETYTGYCEQCTRCGKIVQIPQ